MGGAGFFHLFPAWGALYFSARGTRGALACSSIAALLGVLGVFFTVRRLWGAQPALLAGLLLSVNLVPVWFARNAASETLSQVFIFTGLLALARWQEEGSKAFGALGGVAFGMALLTRVDNVLLLPALAVWTLVLRVGERPWRRLVPIALPLGLLAAHATFHALVFSWGYVASIARRRAWDQPATLAALALLAAGSAVLLTEIAHGRMGAWLRGHDLQVRRAAMLLVLVLALHAALVRPAFSPEAHAILHLAWFLTPLGLALGVLGLMSTLWDGRARHALLVAVTLSYSIFYLYQMRISTDYMFTSRRFLPVILPFALAFAAVFLDRLAERGRVARLASTVLALALLALSARPGLPLRGHTEWAGALELVARIARHVEPGDIVVFEPPGSTHLASLPLWAIHGADVVHLATWQPEPARLEHLVAAWRGRYKGILIVHSEALSLCCVPLRPLERVRFESTVWERTEDRIPADAEPRALRFTVSRVLPVD